MSKAQVEMSFQWIFVLIGGAVFLGIFFFAIKGCLNSGQDRALAGDILYVRDTLSTYVWQPGLNETVMFPQAAVSCPSASSPLTLSTLGRDPRSTGLEGIPVFLPPMLEGQNDLLTYQLILNTSPTIELGNTLYVINDNTYYFIVKDAANNHRGPLSILGPHQNIKILASASDIASQRVPKGAQTVVVVNYNTVATQAPMGGSDSTKTYQLVFLPATQELQYYRRNAGSYAPLGPRLRYTGDALAAGAIIAGTPQVYNCTKTTIVRRMRTTTQILQDRSETIKPLLADANCQRMLTSATADLTRINGLTDDQYLAGLYNKSSTFAWQQRALLENSCPVIG